MAMSEAVGYRPSKEHSHWDHALRYHTMKGVLFTLVGLQDYSYTLHAGVAPCDTFALLARLRNTKILHGLQLGIRH